jgi:hypothetical protein
MAYQCEAGDDSPVLMILTNQQEAETTALCLEHFTEWVAAMHAAMFGETVPVAVAEDKPKRSRKPKATEPPEPDNDGPVADEVTGDETDEDGSRDYADGSADVPIPYELAEQSS